MTTWNKCKMVIYYHYDRYAQDDVTCNVRIDAKGIVVSYAEENELKRIIWRGKEDGPGHYRLKREDLQGEATLHRFKSEDELEGRWRESSQERGMWRITLGK